MLVSTALRVFPCERCIRLSVELLRALYTARSSTALLMLLANDTHPPGLGALLAPIPRPAEPDTGAELRLPIGRDRRQAARRTARRLMPAFIPRTGQVKKSAAPVSRSYIAPTILISP